MKPLISTSLNNFWRTVQKHPIYLLLAVCFNLIMSSAVLAANVGNSFSLYQATALSLLILLTIILSGYLFVVMFQPERF